MLCTSSGKNPLSFRTLIVDSELQDAVLL